MSHGTKRASLRMRRSLHGAASLRRQRGVISATMPFILFAALAAGAVAVDLGHLFVARAELQTAADAAALAGADALMPGTTTGPNWTAAQTAATSAIGLNSSDGVMLQNGSVQVGYWNISGSPAGMEATTITPGTDDTAAVQVTVSRAPGTNGGPVNFFLARLFGVDNGSVSATAVAMVSGPGSVSPGNLFPVALGTCVFNEYWDSQTGTPKIDPSTGAAYEIKFGAGTDSSGCETAQWTSFQLDSNNVPTVRQLIANGNSTTLAIGDPIWIEPGTKTTLYSSVPTGVTVVMPVVNEVASSSQPIVAFAAFYIDESVGGSGKYIQGHLVSGYKIPTGGNGQVGPYFGAWLPPRLAE